MKDAGLEDDPSGTNRDREGRSVAVDRIVPNPDQPRRSFDPADLEDLARSISEKGILQPLIVRPVDDDRGTYQIVAGERRWRAAQIAGLHECPVVIRDFTDSELFEIAIIENIQRADLNPIDEALGYRHLMENHGHTQEKLAKVLGKSRSHVANVLRLTGLPETVQDHVREGRLTSGHARALITSDDPVRLASEVVNRGLSVRDTERLAKQRGSKTPLPEPKTQGGASREREKDADTGVLERDLSAALGLAVSINHGRPGEGGKLVIRYHDLDQLDALCELLSNGLQR
jgi:ParB family chromosome partitioning protein